jgi:hypothetical protein
MRKTFFRPSRNKFSWDISAFAQMIGRFPRTQLQLHVSHAALSIKINSLALKSTKLRFHTTVQFMGNIVLRCDNNIDV